MKDDLTQVLSRKYKLAIKCIQVMPSLEKAKNYVIDRYNNVFVPHEIIFSSAPVPRLGVEDGGGWVWTIESVDPWGDISKVLKILDWPRGFHPSVKSGILKDLRRVSSERYWKSVIYTHIDKLIETRFYDELEGVMFNFKEVEKLNESYFGIDSEGDSGFICYEIAYTKNLFYIGPWYPIVEA